MCLDFVSKEPFCKGTSGIGYKVFDKSNGRYLPIYYNWLHNDGFDIGIKYKSSIAKINNSSPLGYARHFHSFLTLEDAIIYAESLPFTRSPYICKIKWESESPIFGIQMRDNTSLKCIVTEYMTILEEIQKRQNDE